jgi:hypothetical protein
MPASWKIGLQVLNFLPFFLGNILFHLLLINPVYTLGLEQKVGDVDQAWVQLVKQQSWGGRCPRPCRCWWHQSPAESQCLHLPIGPAGGTLLTHVLGTIPKCENPWILWIWFLPTVFCRFSVAGTCSPACVGIRPWDWGTNPRLDPPSLPPTGTQVAKGPA